MGAVIVLLIVGVLAFLVVIVLGVKSGIDAAKGPTVGYRRVNHPTKASDRPVPPDPRFYNIGASTFHKSNECSGFSVLKPWDATTEKDAIAEGMSQCPLCKSTIVFVYPRGKAYHKTRFCSDAQSLPTQMTEAEALTKGLHRCSKCWNRY